MTGITSPEDICNLALDYQGEGLHIKSLEAQDELSRACRREYDAARRECLAGRAWSFAAVDAELHGGDGEVTSHHLPADCVRLLRVKAPGVYKTVGRTLYCEGACVGIRYVRDEADVRRMPSHFVRALATLLASRLPMSGADALTRKERFLRQYHQQLKDT